MSAQPVVSARPPTAPVSSAPSMAAASAPPSSSGSSPTANDSGAHAPALHEQLPPARPTAASVIAKYPAPPPKPLQAPKYAVQILVRQFELRNQLESLRRRRSPDVPLYEAALRSYDVKTFRLGMAINCALLATATLIFFLPVILRFVRAD